MNQKIKTKKVWQSDSGLLVKTLHPPNLGVRAKWLRVAKSMYTMYTIHWSIDQWMVFSEYYSHVSFGNSMRNSKVNSINWNGYLRDLLKSFSGKVFPASQCKSITRWEDRSRVSLKIQKPDVCDDSSTGVWIKALEGNTSQSMNSNVNVFFSVQKIFYPNWWTA